jgi:xanthine dehydrogenase accessory factor
MKEIELWKFVHEKLKNNMSVIFFVVAETSNSSPGRAGFKMALADDGDVIGTIGGGIMEHSLLEEAKIQLSRNEKICYVKKLYHNKHASGDKSGLICGGTQTMIIISLHADETKSIALILQNFENLEKGLLLIDQSGISFLPSKINTAEISFSFTSDNEWQYEENSGIPNTVYVVGGGHVGLAVSRVMSTLDFYVITIDPRKDVFTMLRNTFANKKLSVGYNEVSSHIAEGERSYVVIVTSEHDSDMIALKSVITKNIKYIGMMGSKVKIKSIFKGLEEQGIDPVLFKKVNTPIGIEIEAESPEEIAVSIAAEIIKVKNN